MRAIALLIVYSGYAASCNVGDNVICKDGTHCMGNQCCRDGSTCPSASSSFKLCPRGKTTDCTGGHPGSGGLFPGRCGIAVTDGEASLIESNHWLDAYQGSIGFWYNWNSRSSVTMHASGKTLPFLPMWWGSQIWPSHSEQNSWCSNKGHSDIPKETGSKSVAFAWNEPIGGAGCKWSMGACPGGDYSGTDGAKRAAQNYAGCTDGAKAANRLVSTPCLNNIDPDWFRAFKQNKVGGQDKTICCSHIYASQYNGAPWASCDINAMTNLDRLPGQLQGLVDDGTCDYHFIQEIGIGGCPTADHTVSERLIKNLGNAVRNIPSVYLGWFSNSAGAGGTSRATTWLFQENAGTIGNAYQNMCKSLSSFQNETVMV